ncbi:hypothetical protein [Hydrogenimonas sp.]
MKILKSAFLALALTLFVSHAFAAKYNGFKELKKGEWAILSMDLGNEGKMKEKLVYIGEATMDGTRAYGVEIEVNLPQAGTMISQFWTNLKTDEELKYVMKHGDKLMCMSASMPGMTEKDAKPMTKTPEEFSPEKPILRFDTYTTPTGKKVHVAVFKTDDGEMWVSSETPFGAVKMIKNGKTVLYLEDFGTRARPKIPLSEALSCKPVDIGEMFKGFGGN